MNSTARSVTYCMVVFTLAGNFSNAQIVNSVPTSSSSLTQVVTPQPVAQGGTPPGMPTPPTTTELESKKPKCPSYRVTRTDQYLMEQCRAMWDDYLKINIEGYRQTFSPYVKALNRLDRHLQLMIPKDLTMAQYQEYKDQIADEIADSTVIDGRYIKIYLEYIDAYRRQAAMLKDHYDLASSQ